MNYKISNWKYTHYLEQLEKTYYKSHENFVINSLIHDERLHELKPITQYYVERKDRKYALIDIYFPQINLAIEIDEPPHENNKLKDKERQADIENQINCRFQRITIKSTNILSQIEDLKIFILDLVESEKSNQRWNVWSEPLCKSRVDLQNELKNTLFVKIIGKIHPLELMDRQTGWWKMNIQKTEKVKNVIVVHFNNQVGVVERVFENIVFQKSKDGKFGYSGTEIINHHLLGIFVTDWNFQQTIQYSTDIG